MIETESIHPEPASVETLPPPAVMPVAVYPAPEPLWTRLLSVVAIALIACLAVAHGWRKGYVLAPTDALQLVAPWQAQDGHYVARNEQLLDQTTQFVPWTIYATERYREGQIPLWNPHSQLGAPFIGNGQSAALYPTILLHWKLPKEWSWTISAALRLFIAGLGVWMLAGRYGLRGWPRLLSGVAFMLCGFNVVWLNHPQMNVMPLLPWAILMTEMLLERVALHRIVGAAIVFAVQFLGGHPASCIHLLLACGMVFVLRLIFGMERGPQAGRLNGIAAVKSFWGLSTAIAFGFALAAAQWLPLIEYASHSGAAVIRAEKLAAERSRWIALDPRYLIGLAFPYANGFPDGVAPFELRNVTRLPNTNELAPGFIGTIPFVLAIYAAIVLRRRRGVTLWTIIALIAAAIAIKFPVIDHLVQRIPKLNVAQNARLLVVTALALSILAGYGLDALIRQGLDLARLRKVLLRLACVVAAIAIVAGLGLLLAKGPILRSGIARAEAAYNNGAQHEHTLEYVRGVVGRVHTELVLTCARLLIPAFMLAAMALILRRARAAGALVLLATIDLLAFAVPFNPGAPAETYFPGTPAINKMLQAPARFAATHRTLIPESATAYGLSDIRGYDALAPERYLKWWRHPGIGELDDSKQGYLSKLENPEHPAWGLLNLGYLVTAPDQPAPTLERFKPTEGGYDANVYQATTVRPRAWVAAKAEVSETIEPVLDRVAKMDFNPDETVLLDREVAWDARALLEPSVWTRNAMPSRKVTVDFLGASTLKLEEERPEIVRLRVTGANGGYLVLADTYFPGWTATVINEAAGTGKEVPILPAYGVMRAIPLPASTGYSSPTLRVEFRYRPWSWRVGALVSLMSACLLLLLIGMTLFGRNRAVA